VNWDDGLDFQGILDLALDLRPFSDTNIVIPLFLKALTDGAVGVETVIGTIRAMDNKTSSITMGQKFPIPMKDVAGNTVNQFYSTGFKVDVWSHISSDKSIEIRSTIEISDLDRASALLGIPIINSYEMSATMYLRNGETGIINRKRIDGGGIKKTGPWYLDLPVLRWLFQPYSRIDNYSYQFVLITSWIMD